MSSFQVINKTHYNPNFQAFKKSPSINNFQMSYSKEYANKELNKEILANRDYVNQYNLLRKKNLTAKEVTNNHRLGSVKSTSKDKWASYNDTIELLKKSNVFYQSADKTTYKLSDHEHYDNLEIDYPSKNCIHIPG
jgi:hypothetical protein